MNNATTLIDLINQIVQVHHSFCRREMTRLSLLFKEAIAAHGREYPELKKMGALFAKMVRDLEMHLVKEEQTLFPYIARVEEKVRQSAPITWPAFGTVENPIRMMVEEHDQTGRELSEIRRLSNDYTHPPTVLEALAALYDGLRAFDLNMAEHIQAEDHLLFPRAIAMEEEACARRSST